MSVSNLLILRGVSVNDCAEIVPSYDCGRESTQRMNPAAYTEIPARFTSVDTWPTFSNLKCWNCDRLPIDYPRFIAVNPRIGPAGDECDVHGNFDEWSCAARYILREFPQEQQWDALQSLCLFESKFTGKQRARILPAPPKTEMQAYCGNSGLTMRQYGEKIHAMNSDYCLSQFKLMDFIS